IGKQGAAPGEFASPRWLHFCPYRRNLLVADTQNSRIQILSLTGDVIRIVQHPEMVAPCAVTRASDGRIYVLDAADAKLRIFSPEGNLNQVAGGKPTFKSAFGLALLDSQDLVVTDPEGHCIHMLNPNGQLRDSISQDFKSPSGIIAINQQIYILDFGLPAVFRLNNAGQVVGRFGKRGTGKGDFSVPKGITVNEFGHIFVAEALSHRIQVFDAQGTWVTSFGKKGTGEGEFSNPESLACRPGGLIYVLDRGNHRIQVFKYLTS
ncbi:MAG TPA: NHL repeat-containing protein, partial [Candidatus Obscuribacterales bacterium]